jgi:hypothetical protein
MTSYVHPCFSNEYFSLNKVVCGKRCTVTLSRNHYCHGKAIIRFLSIVIGINVAVHNTDVFGVAEEM